MATAHVDDPAAPWEVVPHERGAPAPETAGAASVGAASEPKTRMASTIVSYVVLAASLVVILLGVVLMIGMSRG